MKKIFILLITLFFTFNSFSQLKLKTNFNYLIGKEDHVSWGFTIAPEYKLSKKFSVGLTTSFFLNGEFFPDYKGYGFWNSNRTAYNQVLTAHRPFTSELYSSYFFNKKDKSTLKPYLQVGVGITVLGTFTNTVLEFPTLYSKSNHEKESYLSVSGKFGLDFELTNNFSINLNAGYNKLFEKNINRFKDAPIDLSDYNLNFGHYFILETGFKFNLN